MILKIGTYQHPARKAWISVRKREVLSRVGTRMWYDTVIVCGGTITDKTGTPATLKTAMDALVTNIVGGQDVRMVLDDGTTPTHHTYLNSETIDGIRLVNFEWLKGSPGSGNAYGSGVELLYKASWRAQFRGEFVTGAYESDIVEWNEWIRQIGTGGPRFRSKGSIEGEVQYQQLQANTSVRLLQGGNAVAITGYPGGATPLFPFDEHEDVRNYEVRTPRWGGLQNVLYGSRWLYNMEYTAPQAFIPTPIP